MPLTQPLLEISTSKFPEVFIMCSRRIGISPPVTVCFPESVMPSLKHCQSSPFSGWFQGRALLDSAHIEYKSQDAERLGHHDSPSWGSWSLGETKFPVSSTQNLPSTKTFYNIQPSFQLLSLQHLSLAMLVLVIDEILISDFTCYLVLLLHFSYIYSWTS